LKFKVDSFVVAIIIVIAVAYFFPQAGRDDSPIPVDAIGSVGISLIFFFYGLKLNREKLVNGLKNWKLHCLVQASTFLLFPLIVIAVHPFIQSEHGLTIWLAFLFLAALPSTVSSSVVMVSMAKGNVAAAIFNASISGLIGIVVTPLWMGLFIQRSTADFDLSDIYFKLAVEIVAPVVLGLLLQRYLGRYVQQFSRQLSLFDKSVILLIIYKSFAESFDQHVFSSVQVVDLVTIAMASMALFFGVYYVTGYLTRLLGFNREDQITAQFCGTKKSLIHGTVFSKILFQNSASMGIMLLPLMLFHAMQIFIISIIASKLGKPDISEGA
jgi:sodium/bile acid cotransporter 7